MEVGTSRPDRPSSFPSCRDPCTQHAHNAKKKMDGIVTGGLVKRCRHIHWFSWLAFSCKEDICRDTTESPSSSSSVSACKLRKTETESFWLWLWESLGWRRSCTVRSRNCWGRTWWYSLEPWGFESEVPSCTSLGPNILFWSPSTLPGCF